MRIGSNLSAFNAITNMRVSQNNLARALGRLSSGKKINTAQDDPAGYAISGKMQLQIIGLKRASQNSLDGVSIVQTAEGALNEVHGMLQRMRQLSVQASNDSNTAEERGIIQMEINQLTSEINKTSVTTKYNKLDLFTGNASPDPNAYIQKSSLAEPYKVTLSNTALQNLNANDEVYLEMRNGNVTEKVRLITDKFNELTPEEQLERFNDAMGKTAIAYINNAGDIVLESKNMDGDSSITISGADYAAVNANGTNPYSITLDGITGGPDAVSNVIHPGDEIFIEVANEFGKRRVQINTEGLVNEKNSLLLDRINGLLDGFATAEFNAAGGIDIKSDTVTPDTRIKFTGKDANKIFTTFPQVQGLEKIVPEGITVNNDIDEFVVNSVPKDFNKNAVGSVNFLEMPEDGSVISIGTKTIGFYDGSKSDKTNSTIDIDINGKDLNKVVQEVVSEYKRIEQEALNPKSNDAYIYDGLKLALDPNTSSKITITSPEVGEVGEFVKIEGHKNYNEIAVQFGANAYDQFFIKIDQIDAKSLRIASNSAYGNPGVAGAVFSNKKNVVYIPGTIETQYALDITTQQNANFAITVYDNALMDVARLRADLGAVQNRLERTVDSLNSASENLTDSLSRLSDTDYAEEFTTFTTQNVLAQSANAMLAQANQLPQMVMKLLE